VQESLKQVIEPIFEREFSDNSYGFRPGRGCKDALREVDRLLKEGYQYIVDVDLKRYFETIPHDKLMSEIGKRIADGRVLKLIESFLKQVIMKGLKEWYPEEGTPQGGVISPLLANIYLNPLDQKMKAEGFTMIRYADDIVVLCCSKSEAVRAMEQIQIWVRSAGLKLHSDKTGVADMTQIGTGFDFLGYHFERTRFNKKLKRWARKKSMQKLKDAIRSQTKRSNGNSLKQIIVTINPILRGWFEYFKHGNKSTFTLLDKWIRMRLRSILRKRTGRRGCGRGRDNNRWTNAFFAEHGLFSLIAAYETACQSSMR